MFDLLGDISQPAPVEPLESRQMLAIAVVGLRAATASTTEGGGPSRPAAILVERSGGDLASPLAVSFTLGGTASSDDYAALVTDVIIPAKVRSFRLPVIAIDDTVAENPEQVVVTVSASDAYTIVSNRRTATVTINDNEPIVSISRSKDASEGKTTATAGVFTIKRSAKDLSQPFTVDLVLQSSPSPTRCDWPPIRRWASWPIRCEPIATRPTAPSMACEEPTPARRPSLPLARDRGAS